MGLLDDAIREHLDLKRRRGSDPAEVAREEQEALGPVRREPEPAQAADAHNHEQQHEHRHDEAPAVGAADPHPHVDDHHDHHEAEPARAEAPAPDPDPRHSDVHDEELSAAADQGDAEDMLEETPDFLQETPEHDRLWFEQRPPRDFDFDG